MNLHFLQKFDCSRLDSSPCVRMLGMLAPCVELSLSPCHLELVKEGWTSSLIRHSNPDLKKYFYFRAGRWSPPPRLLQLNFSCLTWIAFIPVDTGGPSISRSIPGRKNPAGHNRGPEGVKTRRILLPHSYKLCTCLWPHFTCSPGPSAKKRSRTTKFKRLHQLIAQLFIRKSEKLIVFENHTKGLIVQISLQVLLKIS